MKGKSRAVSAAGLGVILSLSIATSAPAAVTGIDVGDGRLEAKGLLATVPFTFTCDQGAQYNYYVVVRQATQQKTITEGSSGNSGSCTGEPQTITVQLRPNPKPFKHGRALAEVGIDTFCYVPELGYYDYCGGALVAEEIALR